MIFCLFPLPSSIVKYILWTEQKPKELALRRIIQLSRVFWSQIIKSMGKITARHGNREKKKNNLGIHEYS